MRWFGHVRVSISRSKPKPQASFFIISAQESVIERKEYRLKWEIEFGPTCILAKFSVWLVQLLMREFNASGMFREVHHILQSLSFERLWCWPPAVPAACKELQLAWATSCGQVHGGDPGAD